MNQAVKGVLIRIVGLVFLVLGILGLFLPLLQGILFLVIGAALLTYRTPLFRWLRLQQGLDRLADQVEGRWPRLARWLRVWSRQGAPREGAGEQEEEAEDAA